jgi:hypothetical protein
MLDPKIANWESQQNFASFYQGQVNTVQQGAIAAQAGPPLVLVFFAQWQFAFPVPSEFVMTLPVIVAFGWVITSLMLFRRFEVQAVRVLSAYEAEWDIAFSGEVALSLQGFLLDPTYRRRRSR